MRTIIKFAALLAGLLAGCGLSAQNHVFTDVGALRYVENIMPALKKALK